MEEFYRFSLRKDGRQSRCKICGNAGTAEWHKSHPEITAKQHKQYAIKNVDKLHSYITKYNFDNRVKRRAYSKEWVEQNRDKYRKTQRAWKTKNIESVRMRGRLYQAARRTGSDKQKPSFVQELMQIQGGLCVVCKVDIRNKFHLDHILPVSRGGSGEKDNLQLLCVNCNCRKSARHPDVFMKENLHANLRR